MCSLISLTIPIGTALIFAELGSAFTATFAPAGTATLVGLVSAVVLNDFLFLVGIVVVAEVVHGSVVVGVTTGDVALVAAVGAVASYAHNSAPCEAPMRPLQRL